MYILYILDKTIEIIELSKFNIINTKLNNKHIFKIEILWKL